MAVNTLEICQPPHNEIDPVAYEVLVQGTAVNTNPDSVDDFIRDLGDGYVLITGFVRAQRGGCRKYEIDGRVTDAALGDGPVFVRWDGTETQIADIIESPQSPDNGTNGDEPTDPDTGGFSVTEKAIIAGSLASVLGFFSR